MWDAICEICSRYIHNTEEPLRWLPIVALVYLLFEAQRAMVFWMERRHPIWRQEVPAQLRRRWLREHQARALLLAVAIIVSWGCAFMFLELERREPPGVRANACDNPPGMAAGDAGFISRPDRHSQSG